jgi:hypothetical protein
MPLGVPPYVSPWKRANWTRLNRGQRLYAIQEYQVRKVRIGEPIPDIPEDIQRAVNIPSDWISKKASILFDAHTTNVPEVSSGSNSRRQRLSLLSASQRRQGHPTGEPRIDAAQTEYEERARHVDTVAETAAQAETLN